MSRPPEPAAGRSLTVDDDHELSDADATKLARRYFLGGFLGLPWLWCVNCYFFWPVLRQGGPADIRKYVLGSAIGFSLFTAILIPWSLAFALGGEWLLGPRWRHLAVYNIADRWQMWFDAASVA